MSSFDGGKAQMERIERANERRRKERELFDTPRAAVGKYIVNADDISDRSLVRAYQAMASDLSAMVEEAKIARARIRERQAIRETNFQDSGGAKAFPSDELFAHNAEGRRLALHEDTLTRILDDATALGGAVRFAAMRYEPV